MPAPPKIVLTLPALTDDGTEKVKVKSLKKFREKAEEHRLWVDQEVFQEQEYDRRRMEKRRRKKEKQRDKMYRARRKCYIPAVTVAVVGSILLMVSSIDNLAGKSIFFTHREAFQICGGVMLGFGVLMVMVVAGITYRSPEERHAKLKNFNAVGNSYTDLNTSCDDVNKHSIIEKLPKETEINSLKKSRDENLKGLITLKGLNSEQTSAAFAKTWVNNHSKIFERSASSLRRQYSDPVLDQSLAIRRLLAWQQAYYPPVPDLSCTNCPHEARPCPIYSLTSTSSSGYKSYITSVSATSGCGTKNGQTKGRKHVIRMQSEGEDYSVQIHNPPRNGKTRGCDENSEANRPHLFCQQADKKSGTNSDDLTFDPERRESGDLVPFPPLSPDISRLPYLCE
ncbi:uncharacterized protein LOC131957815 [Physella acuta]|uniref:uncharacterized protein LOC131957815 n=1 Tax=Physella acuta TaxID=109671 RepID=UPI0027DAD090|nr:uncharacterized protein LOC131957815 [Physella acuta]